MSEDTKLKIADFALYALLVGVIIYLATALYGVKGTTKVLESQSATYKHQIDSLAKTSKSYADSAKQWRELAKDCDLTVDSLNQVLVNIGKARLQVKREVDEASDTALVRLFYANLYADE